MATISPILYVHGTVRAVQLRTVEAVPARDAQPPQYDDRGNLQVAGKPAREARPAYDVHDITVDTFQPGSTVPCGLVEVLVTPRSMEATGGYLPAMGDVVEWPVRGYQKWLGREGNRFRVNGYSFAGDVYAAAEASKKTPRPAAASA